MNSDNISVKNHQSLKSLGSEASIARSILKTAFDNNLPFAAWRLPGESAQHYIIDTSSQLNFVEHELNELPAGFLVHPFNNFPPQFAKTSQIKPLLIKADIHFSSENFEIRINQHENEKDGSTDAKDTFYNSIINNLNDTTGNPQSYFTNSHVQATDTPREKFINTVNDALEAIQAGDFQKVVPSRIKKSSLKNEFDPVQSFLSLCQTYSQAFVSLVSVPGLGTWMGASPEILIKAFQDPESHHSIFQTVALAGTQQIKSLGDIRNVSWRQKEIEEQAMVSRYIINCFKHIRLREFEELGPKTVQAGNLMHLKTLFTVDMDHTNFPELPSTMLKLLHPTSAVCGMPKETSLDFIKKHEEHPRDLFSGYIGPVNLESRIDLFVNLRCVQVGLEEAIFYAGAGITSDSDPQHEWNETEMKINTLSEMITDHKKR